GLHPEHHDRVRAGIHRLIEVVGDLRGPVRDPGGQERGRSDEGDVRAEGVQQVDVRAGDPGVQHVTDDRDVDAVEVVAACCGVVPAADEVAANGERVEQRLGRVLVSAVPGVDDPRVDPPRGGEAFGRPGGAVADDDG